MQQSLFNDNQPKDVRTPDLHKANVRRRNGHKKGTWDKKYYKELYDWMCENLKYSPTWYLKGEKPCPIEHVKTYFPLISDCVHRGDYEATQAIKDAIIDFLNKLGAEIPDDAVLKIPEYKPMKFSAFVCYGKEDDPTGFASGGADL